MRIPGKIKIQNLLSLIKRPKILFVFILLFINALFKNGLKASGLFKALNFSGPVLDLIPKLNDYLVPNQDLKSFTECLFWNLGQKPEYVKMNAGMPDEYICPSCAPSVKIKHLGIENYLMAKGGNRPIILLSHHHGNMSYAEKSMIEMFPEIALVTWGRVIYGRTASIVVSPHKKNSAQDLFVILQAMRSGRTIMHYFDGASGLRNYACDFFGVKIYLSPGFLKLAKDFNASILPLTAYSKNKNELDIIIGKSLFEGDMFCNISNEDMMERIVSYFVRDLKQRNPWSVDPRAVGALLNPSDG